MIQTFKLKKGEISFETDKVRISDDSKKQSHVRLFSSGMWTIYGFFSVLRYFKTGDQFLLWTGLFIGIAHLVIFMLHLFRSNQSEILFDDIKSINVKQKFSHNFVDIRLKNNRLRRIIGVDNPKELEEILKHIKNETNNNIRPQ